MNGLLLIDKPVGMSSAAVVGILKRRLRVDRIGHAGTLDPFASGLLVLLVGRATRLAAYAVTGAKVYAAEVAFGFETDTEDCTGTRTVGLGEQPSLEAVTQVARRFVGTIEQLPPNFSAKKVKGERAYALARRGEEFVLEPAVVTIDSLEVWSESREDGATRFFFRVACSKGTYIRSVARDLGRALGCGAHLTALRREQSVPFSLTQAVVLEECSSQSLVGWDLLFPDAVRCELREEELPALEQGREREIARVVARLQQENTENALHAIAVTPRGQPHSFFVRGDEGWRLGVCAPVLGSTSSE